VLLHEEPPVAPAAGGLGGDGDDEVAAGHDIDVMATTPGGTVNREAIEVAQPPLVAIARRVRRERGVDPGLGHDPRAVPLTAVEVEVAKASHVARAERQAPAAGTVPLRVLGPARTGALSTALCLGHAERGKEVLVGEGARGAAGLAGTARRRERYCPVIDAS
jgi:hypothetical protein